MTTERGTVPIPLELINTVAKDVLNATPFDTDRLLRLRLAQYLQVNSRIILLIEETPSALRYTTLPLVLTLEEDPVSLWNTVSEFTTDLSLYDFALFYAQSREGTEDLLPLLSRLFLTVENVPSPFNSLLFLEREVQALSQRLASELPEQQLQLQEEGVLNQALSSLTPVNTSLPEYESAIITATLTPATPTAPEELFNDLSLSLALPYASYQEFTAREDNQVPEQKFFYKLYRGKGFEPVPPLQVEWLENNPNALELPNTQNGIYSMLNLNKAENEAGLVNPEQFFPAFYSWKDYRLTIRLQGEHSPREAVERYLSHYTTPLSYSNLTTTLLTGTIKIRGRQIREELFSDLAMNDPIFQRYLVFRQTSLTVITSRRPLYLWRSEHSYLQFSIENRNSRVNEAYPLEGRMELMEEGTPYLLVRFQAQDQDLLQNLRQILPYLFAYYFSREEDLLAEYNRLVPEYLPLTETRTRAVVVLDTNIKRLENVAPRIFRNNYSRACQGEARQPVLLDTPQALVRQSQPVRVGSELLPRQSITFPIKGEDLPREYGCHDDRYPFPGLFVNKNENRDVFPYLPCCFPQDQSNTQGNPYGVYYRNEEPKERTDRSKAGNIIRTDRFLEFGQVGILPEQISYLIRSVRESERMNERGERGEGGERGEWFRFGVASGANSALHCLSYALDPDYPFSEDFTRKEEYINEVRADLARIIPLASLRQETYELSLEEVQAYLSDPSTFFDTRYLIRACELYYGIRLVVFDVREGQINFERPVSYQASFKPLARPEQETVILYRHLGGKADLPDYPRYELVGRDQGERNFLFSFTGNLTVELARAYSHSQKAEEWTYSPEGTLLHDPYYNVVVDWTELFSLEQITGQYLDRNGKLRGFITQGFVVLTPFSQPLPVREVSLEQLIRVPVPSFSSFYQLITRLQSQGVLAYMYSAVMEEDLRGVWWYLDRPTRKSLLFTPLTGTVPPDALNQLQINYLPYPSLLKYQVESGQEYFSYLSRVKYYLTQITEYAFWLYYLTEEDPKSVELFLARFTEVRNNHRYEVRGVNRTFPDTLEIEEWFAQVQAPTYIFNGKIILSSEELRQRVRSALHVLAHRIEGSTVLPSLTMTQFYSTLGDFTAREGELLFDRYSHALNWIRNLQGRELLQNANTVITPEHYLLTQPYLLAYPIGNFLVQNVLDGNLARALKVAQEWNEFKVNLGYQVNIEEGLSQSLPYQVSEVNEEGLLLEPTGELSSALHLVRYPNGHYSALLPLH